MAWRNWINIYPDPETRLSALIDALKSQLELHGGPPAQPPISVATAEPAPAQAPATAPTMPPPAVASPARNGESWFPLGRFDLYILVPIFVSAFLFGIFSTGDNKAT